MGNTSSSAHVSLAVRTDKVAYMAGETVKGSVYVMVTAETQVRARPITPIFPLLVLQALPQCPCKAVSLGMHATRMGA